MKHQCPKIVAFSGNLAYAIQWSKMHSIEIDKQHGMSMRIRPRFSDEKAASSKAIGKAYKIRTDETCLLLDVSITGRKSWLVSFTASTGKKSSMIAGKFPAVKFSQARAIARFIRSRAAAGMTTREIRALLDGIDQPRAALLTKCRNIAVCNASTDERECASVSDLAELSIDDLESLAAAVSLEIDIRRLQAGLANKE